MKCPKCGYNSFDYLDSCKKCGNDLQAHKSKFGLRSLLFPGLAPAAPAAASAALVESDTTDELVAESSEAGDFGFDFMSDDEPVAETSDTVETSDSEAGEEDFEFAADELGETAESAAEPDDDSFSFDDEGLDAEAAELGEEPDLEETDRFAIDADESAPDLTGEGDEEALDFSEWDAPEEEDPKKPREGEEPSDPFDGGGTETADRAPVSTDTGDLAALFDASDAAVPAEPDEERTTIPAGVLPETGDAALSPEPGPAVAAPTAADETSDPAEPEEDWVLAFEPLEHGESPVNAAPAEDGAAAGVPDLTGRDAPLFAPAASVGEPAGAPDQFAEFETPLPPEDESLRPPTPARVVAATVDGVVLASVFLLFLVAGELTTGAPDGFLVPSIDTLVELAAPYFLVLFALCFGYFTLFHYLTGQTPGKMIFGLRVESIFGTPLGFSQAFLRSVGGLISLLCGGIGYLVALLNRSGRGWNDQLAGTRLTLLPAEDGAEEVDEDRLSPV